MHKAPPLSALIRLMLEQPERSESIEGEIYRLYSVHKTVLVLDLSGFTIGTSKIGIARALARVQHATNECKACLIRSKGRLVKGDADNIFVVFDAVTNAVTASTQMLRRLRENPCKVPPIEPLSASIGIGCGDVLLMDNEVYGPEVNLASRLGEDVADAGSILLTPNAYMECNANGHYFQHGADPSGTEYYKLLIV